MEQDLQNILDLIDAFHEKHNDKPDYPEGEIFELKAKTVVAMIAVDEFDWQEYHSHDGDAERDYRGER